MGGNVNKGNWGTPSAERIETLKQAIADAHIRMATNTDPNYRTQQYALCDNWLAELTNIFENHIEIWVEYQSVSRR